MAVLPLSDNDALASEKEKEKARLEQELEAKSLRELMALQKAMEKEAEGKATVLHAVQQGNLSALKPYLQRDTKSDFIRLSDEDAAHSRELVSREHLRNVSTLQPINKNSSAEEDLAFRKKWLQKTFPTIKTEVVIVHSTSGETFLQTLGLSGEESDAAIGLQEQQKAAAKKSLAAKDAIEHKISEPSQQPSGPPNEHETISLARTPPQVQKDAASRNRNLPV